MLLFRKTKEYIYHCPKQEFKTNLCRSCAAKEQKQDQSAKSAT